MASCPLYQVNENSNFSHDIIMISLSQMEKVIKPPLVHFLKSCYAYDVFIDIDYNPHFEGAFLYRSP